MPKLTADGTGIEVLAGVTASAICALLAAAHPAYAKPDYSETQTQTISDEYADCVVKENTQKAREFVGRNLPEDIVLRQFRALNDGGCLINAAGSWGGVTMRFPAPHFRFAMARALVRLDYSTNPFQDFKTVPPFARDVFPPLDQEKLPKSKRRANEIRVKYASAHFASVMDRFGECVARANPAAAQAFASSKLNTPARGAAVAQIKPVLGGCLAEGTVKLDAFYLTGAVAVNYYRLAYQASHISVSAAQTGITP